MSSVTSETLRYSAWGFFVTSFFVLYFLNQYPAGIITFWVLFLLGIICATFHTKKENEIKKEKNLLPQKDYFWHFSLAAFIVIVVLPWAGCIFFSEEVCIFALISPFYFFIPFVFFLILKTIIAKK